MRWLGKMFRGQGPTERTRSGADYQPAYIVGIERQTFRWIICKMSASKRHLCPSTHIFVTTCPRLVGRSIKNKAVRVSLPTLNISQKEETTIPSLISSAITSGLELRTELESTKQGRYCVANVKCFPRKKKREEENRTGKQRIKVGQMGRERLKKRSFSLVASAIVHLNPPSSDGSRDLMTDFAAFVCAFHNINDAEPNEEGRK